MKNVDLSKKIRKQGDKSVGVEFKGRILIKQLNC